MRLWGLEGRRGGQDCKSKSYPRRHPRLFLSCRSESGGNQEEQHFQVITEVARRHRRTLNDPIFCLFFPPLLLPLKVVSKLFAVWIAQGFENVEPGSGQGNLCLYLYKIASKIGAIEERCDALKFWGGR